MSSNLKVAVSGKSGCGNTTVSRLLAERLGIRLINYTFHDMAEEKGIAFDRLHLLAEEDSQYDLFLDRKQVELASRGSCVLGSRLAIRLLKDADLKVYLSASPEVRARRIAEREGLEFRPALKSMERRDQSDRRRYLALYGIDTDIFDFSDLVVNTEIGDQFYVVDEIMKRLEEKQKIK